MHSCRRRLPIGSVPSARPGLLHTEQVAGSIPAAPTNRDERWRRVVDGAPGVVARATGHITTCITTWRTFVARRKRRDDELTVVQVGAAVSGHPYIAAALKLAGLAAGRFRNRRIGDMWKHVVEGMDDPLTFTKDVERALLKDGDEVAYAFVEAAQAAAEAVAFSVVPSIGLLARKLLNPTGSELKPRPREYRLILAMLRGLEDSEFGALRLAVHRMCAINVDPLDTIIELEPRADGIRVWRWRCMSSVPDTDLVIGEVATGVVTAIAPFAVGEQMYAKSGSTRERPQIPLRTVQLLADIMPIPG